MDERAVRAALQTLTWEEAAVMYWRCLGHDPKHIAKHYHYGESTIWGRLKDGRNKLTARGIEGDPCDTLFTYGEPKEDNWPPSDGWVSAADTAVVMNGEFEEIEGNRPEEKPGGIEPYRRGPIVVTRREDEPPPRVYPDRLVRSRSRRLRRLLLWLIAITAVLLALFVVFGGDIFGPDDLEPPAIGQTSTEVPEQVVQLTLDTPLNTSQPTDTTEPTSTAEPTNTAEPTDTPVPTQTPAPVLSSGETFMEDFSDGVDEEAWERIQGNWDILDGRMVAAERVQLAFGELSSADYEITVKIKSAPGHQDGNFICVRCTASEGVFLEFGNGPWSGTRAPEILVMEDNEKRRLKFYYTRANDNLLTIRIIDNNFNAFMGINELISYQMTNEYGEVNFTINQGTSLEWISIERLD